VAVPGEVLYPDYYLQNYHWQTDGWMSAKSAAAYEAQTETLFQGCQDAMQRAALVPLARYMAGRDPAATTLLEVAAGTGRFHTFIKDNWPTLRTTCSELSPYYLAAARENMEYFATEFNPLVNPGREMARTAFVQCAAEALPFEDASFDVLMNVYLYHELPMEARIAATAEFARVVRPGGLCVINDSLQRGDRAEMDAVMPRFSELYHEPWHLDYTETDMVALFDAAGFSCVDIQLAHVSKVWAFVRR
jgi:ubiquinone/menaquinone biosynthesis C-methylase UbiE